MIGVRKDNRDAKVFPKIALAQTFYRGLCAYRHEDRGWDIAVFGMKDAGARPRHRTFGKTLQGDLTRQVRIVVGVAMWSGPSARVFVVQKKKGAIPKQAPST